MQKPIIEIPRAQDQVVNALIQLGYLEIREDGVHVNENIPTQTVKSE